MIMKRKLEQNTYVACLRVFASCKVDSDGLFSTTEVLLKYKIGTAGMLCSLYCKSVS